MSSRRHFLRKLSQVALIAGGTALLPRGLRAESLLGEDAKTHKLTILHTNDVHSRIEPFPMDGGRNQGAGGVARRAALIRQIRAEEERVLLLDAGDMFQGTPYFNFFKGEVEVKTMSQMGYNAGTIGNHDFDAGLENLHQQIKQHATFPLINSNYDFKDTIMKGQVLPYKIIELAPLRIGIIGVGIELEGLVPKALCLDTQYQDPIERANYYAQIVKNDYHCDYVICLSHLGYSYKDNKISDLILATQSTDIDLIIGGHTHTFIDQATVVKNKKDREILVTQAGWAGILLGRIEVYFERGFNKKCIQCKPIEIK